MTNPKLLSLKEVTFLVITCTVISFTIIRLIGYAIGIKISYAIIITLTLILLILKNTPLKQKLLSKFKSPR